MSYYEEATVKKYKRKNNKDSTQINLGVNSKFKKNEKVIVIRESDFNKLNKNHNVDFKKELDEIKAGFEKVYSHDEHEDLKNDYDVLKDKLIKEKEEKEKLLIKIATHETAIGNKEKLIATKDNTIDNYEKDIEKKDNIIETLTHNWKWYKRIFNILPGDVLLNRTEDE